MPRIRSVRVPEEERWCRSADDLLAALVECSDRLGRFWGHPALMQGMFWAQEDLTAEVMGLWLRELVERGDVQIRRGHDGEPAQVSYICNRSRFERYRNRQWVPVAVRRRVMERDEFRCVECAATEDLSLDHIIPFSKGGSDTEDNLRVLCRPCNSRKGARLIMREEASWTG